MNQLILLLLPKRAIFLSGDVSLLQDLRMYFLERYNINAFMYFSELGWTFTAKRTWGWLKKPSQFTVNPPTAQTHASKYAPKLIFSFYVYILKINSFL